MYILCFVIVLLMPAAMFLVGVRWKISPPPFQSRGLAYRTAQSAKNEDTWAFAHRHCARLWIRIGLILGVISGALLLVFRAWYQNIALWILVGQMIFFCISAFLVDLLLKNCFDEDGNQIS